MGISQKTNILGVFQSDLIIQSAIVESLKRMRDNSIDIDYAFQSLNTDILTKEEYGEKQIQEFKHWFLHTDIPVAPSFREDETVLPQITFSLMSSDETDQTLGDINYVSSERTEADWPVVAGPFNPVMYTASSGMMQLPDSIDQVISCGMCIQDRDGRKHKIVEVMDDDLISLAPGTQADFNNALIVGKRFRDITTIESTFMKEAYQIGVHVQNNAFNLIALHAILSYALNKNKEELLEARGFEISTIRNTEFRRNDQFGPELVYSRWLNIVGWVKHVWAKRTFPAVDELTVQPTMSQVGIIISPVGDDSMAIPVDDEGETIGNSDESFFVQE